MHPARSRAIDVPKQSQMPPRISEWCSLIPAEEVANYPIDQSDGGEDDDPAEHTAWVAKLKEIGRNPGMPWMAQSDQIEIDADQDYISDRGDEVWNILQARGIKNVILTGVHVNMCVLGRPFGLRQLAHNGKNVVLMRDMTDSMYNPKRWPYVSHHEGTRRVIAHIERYICPTITSDQILGGNPFRFNEAGTEPASKVDAKNFVDHWTALKLPTEQLIETNGQSVWCRAVVRVPQDWEKKSVSLLIESEEKCKLWWNGDLQNRQEENRFLINENSIVTGEANLVVLQHSTPQGLTREVKLAIGEDKTKFSLAGRWQVRAGNEAFGNMPLPAKFGASTDIVFRFDQELWSPQVVTQIGHFTPGIEGPACDRHGNIFAVNFLEQGTIGKVSPQGLGEIFVTLPEGSTGNGIRFDNQGNFFVADYTGHYVLRVDATSRKVSVFAHEEKMNQPNDLAIAPDGTLFASDPNWGEGTGQLWRIDIDGTVTLLASDMGTTNGIEVSPDGRTLYVNESKQRNIWAFTITENKSLKNKRLVKQFSDHGFDGMRCDVDGNLYVTRYGKGTVVKLSPTAGKILREIPVLGARPSNICFGGPDGRTAYVTEVEYQRLVSFRVDRAGRSFVEQKSD